MKKGTIILIVVAVVIVLAVGIYFAVTSNNYVMYSANTPNSGSNIPSANGNSVAIESFAFSPATLNVKIGDTVIWTNKDSAPHTITSDSGSELSSLSFSNGGTYSHTFDSVGEFDYHCSIHVSMKGKVIVS